MHVVIHFLLGTANIWNLKCPFFHYLFDQEFTLVVDHCENSEVDENIANSTADRSMCEDMGMSDGENYLLNVLTPLELGGRLNSEVNFPNTIISSRFNGCMKNLYWNGKVSYGGWILRNSKVKSKNLPNKEMVAY